MPRKITSHRNNALNEAIEITARDDIGTGGAPIVYDMTVAHETESGLVMVDVCSIRFQNGAIQSARDFNGFTNEALLAIVEDRLEKFQQGVYSSRENACALTHLQECLLWLGKRTADRKKRGVEGQIIK